MWSFEEAWYINCWQVIDTWQFVYSSKEQACAQWYSFAILTNLACDSQLVITWGAQVLNCMKARRSSLPWTASCYSSALNISWLEFKECTRCLICGKRKYKTLSRPFSFFFLSAQFPSAGRPMTHPFFFYFSSHGYVSLTQGSHWPGTSPRMSIGTGDGSVRDPGVRPFFDGWGRRFVAIQGKSLLGCCWLVARPWQSHARTSPIKAATTSS